MDTKNEKQLGNIFLVESEKKWKGQRKIGMYHYNYNSSTFMIECLHKFSVITIIARCGHVVLLSF